MNKSIIKLRDDNGHHLEITLTADACPRQLWWPLRVWWPWSLWTRRLAIQKPGLWAVRFWTVKSAIAWADDLLLRSAQAESNGELSVIALSQHRRLSTRDAVRLGFAVRQILLTGTAYFSVEYHGDAFFSVHYADHPCPHVRLASVSQRFEVEPW